MRYPVIYSDSLPSGVGGQQRGPFIFIRPKYRDDEGIFRHEYEHIKQAWATLFIGHALLYLFCRVYRQWAEVRAYRVQMQYGLPLDDAALRLTSNRYNLGISLEEARAVLTKES